MKKRKFEWGYLLILPGIGYIVFMICTAVYMMVMQSFGFYNYVGESAFSLDFWKNVVNEQFIDSLLFSLKIGVLSSLISILICYVLATYLQNAWGGKALLHNYPDSVFHSCAGCSVFDRECHRLPRYPESVFDGHPFDR